MPQPPLPHLILLTGLSGSGKTALLQVLSQTGFAVIDAEAIAQHQGSALGHLPFINRPFVKISFQKALANLVEQFRYEPFVFAEWKGSAIGKNVLPQWYVQWLRTAFTVFINVPRAARVAHLAKSYNAVAAPDFAAAIEKLKDALGIDEREKIKALIHAGDYTAAIDALLHYYDNVDSYTNTIAQPKITLRCNEVEPAQMATALSNVLLQHHPLFRYGRELVVH